MKIETRRVKIEYRDPFKMYKELSDNGNNISLLMESRSKNLKYGKASMIVPNPAVRIVGQNENFIIEALTPAGKEVLKLFSEEDFDYADNYEQDDDVIRGIVKKEQDKDATEDGKRKLKNISFVLKTILDKFDCDNSQAGLYGAFAYDFARNFYNIGSRFKNDKGKDFVLFIPTRVYFFDDIKEKAEMIEFSFNGAIDNMETMTKGFEFEKQRLEVSYDLSEKEYLDKVNKIIKEIKNGRVMQCVFSRTLSASLQKHPIDSYAELREINPSPYSFFYNLGDNEILYGASPEMHIKIQDRKIEIRPIAGTVMRSDNPLEDAKRRIQLLTDEKELREHTMLVDLARHELYHLSESDSVYVSDLFTLENYPNLYHLVSGVKGKLREDADAIDALLITLPAGTLSGAPKQEAMKMIEEYEGSKRTFYGGTIGLISFNGFCNTGITIRSVHVKDNMSNLRSGGGIVALSTPRGELDECKLKMSKSLKVLGVKL